MKANWIRQQTKKQKKQIREDVGKELRKQTGDITRRLFKLFCLSLNEGYGFGKQRLMRVIDGVNERATGRETDEAFWKHVDDRMEQLGMMFQRENYDEMDR